MAFRIAARTILHLGGELISSDGIAFYELIKNAFDAGSRHVDVRVVCAIPFEIVTATIDELAGIDSGDSESTLDSIVSKVEEYLDLSAENADFVLETLQKCRHINDVRAVISEANFIEFIDEGHGMSLSDLRDVYLTIGTPHRLKQRRLQSGAAEGRRAILGEKGIGRLSAMRLGQLLHVKSTTAGETHWNELNIDWRDFDDVDQLLGAVSIDPHRGDKKKSKKDTGTTIRISLLNSEWTESRLEHIGKTELSKLTDPFQRKSAFPVKLFFNGKRHYTERIDKVIFEHAHAKVSASFQITANGPVLAGVVDYFQSPARKTILRNMSFPFQIDSDDLISVSGFSLQQLSRVGPFTMICYWFNRRILTSIDAIGDRQEVLDLVKRWSGGLMLFRDGFRVPPYGGGDEDWLDLDRKALASQGYKVNRAQLIGKVDISTDGNPRLRDQANREGLMDCPEKLALVQMLKYVLEGRLRFHLTEVDRELKGIDTVSFEALGSRLEDKEESINQGLAGLRDIASEYEDIGIGRIEKSLRSAFTALKRVFTEAQAIAETAEDEKSRVFHLAGLGMLVETLAHELNRATRHALDAVVRFRKRNDEELLDNVKLQLDNLQRRLSVLDPLSTSGRRRKQTFDVVAFVDSILSSHDTQFKRFGIEASLTCIPKSCKELSITFVKGMFVQIIENLVDNSVYWLTREKDEKSDPTRSAKCISIEIDCNRLILTYSDSGPGIAYENREEVFKPFFTLKPAGKGKGLGLYIAREIAEYHGASLFLLAEETTVDGRLNKFELDFSEAGA